MNAARLVGQGGTLDTLCTLMLGGQTMLGRVVSTKVMIWLQLAWLLQASVAVQVHRKMRTAGQLAGNSSSVLVTTGFGSQTSLTWGGVNMATAPLTHSCVSLPLQTNTGGVVSTNVMIWLQLAELPQASVAVQVHRKMRTAGHLAGNSSSALVTTGFVSQLSLTCGGVNLGMAPITHSCVSLPLQINTGAIVSRTVMIWTQHTLFWQESVTQCVRVIVPPQVPPTSGPSEQV
jgi:hypothetical protein